MPRESSREREASRTQQGGRSRFDPRRGSISPMRRDPTPPTLRNGRSGGEGERHHRTQEVGLQQEAQIRERMLNRRDKDATDDRGRQGERVLHRGAGGERAGRANYNEERRPVHERISLGNRFRQYNDNNEGNQRSNTSASNANRARIEVNFNRSTRRRLPVIERHRSDAGGGGGGFRRSRGEGADGGDADGGENEGGLLRRVIGVDESNKRIITRKRINPVSERYDPASVPRGRAYFEHDYRGGNGGSDSYHDDRMYDPREESLNNNNNSSSYVEHERRRGPSGRGYRSFGSDDRRGDGGGGYHYPRRSLGGGCSWKHDKFEELLQEEGASGRAAKRRRPGEASMPDEFEEDEGPAGAVNPDVELKRDNLVKREGVAGDEKDEPMGENNGNAADSSDGNVAGRQQREKAPLNEQKAASTEEHLSVEEAAAEEAVSKLEIL